METQLKAVNGRVDYRVFLTVNIIISYKGIIAPLDCYIIFLVGSTSTGIILQCKLLQLEPPILYGI